MSKNKDTLCPCCENFNLEEVGEYEMCENCGWFDDPLQRSDPDYTGGRNKASLNQAKKAYAEGKKFE